MRGYFATHKLVIGIRTIFVFDLHLELQMQRQITSTVQVNYRASWCCGVFNLRNLNVQTNTRKRFYGDTRHKLKLRQIVPRHTSADINIVSYNTYALIPRCS